MREIICKGCQKSVILYGTEDPHAALQCDCCPEDHHHGIATQTTGVPCRPVHHIYRGEAAAPGTAG